MKKLGHIFQPSLTAQQAIAVSPPNGFVSEPEYIDGHWCYRGQNNEPIRIDSGSWDSAGPIYVAPYVLRTDRGTQLKHQTNALQIQTPTTRSDGSPLQDGDQVNFSLYPAEDNSGAEDVLLSTSPVTLAPGTGQTIEGRADTIPFDNSYRWWVKLIYKSSENGWRYAYVHYLSPSIASTELAELKGPDYASAEELVTGKLIQFHLATDNLDIQFPDLNREGSALQNGDIVSYSIRPLENSEEVITATATVTLIPASGQKIEKSSVPIVLMSAGLDNYARVEFSYVYHAADNAWYLTESNESALSGSLWEVDAVKYGCDKTGATDCSAELQAAIDYAVSSGIKRVRLHAGTYKLSSSVTVDHGVFLVGAGRYTTRLLPDAGVTALYVKADHNLKRRFDQVTFSTDQDLGTSVVGIGISGTNGSNQKGIVITGECDHIMMRDVFLGWLDQALVVGHNGGVDTPAYVRESKFWDVLVTHSGTASLPAVLIEQPAFTASGDGTNQLDFYGLEVLYSLGVGLQIKNAQTTESLRRIHFHGLMAHGRNDLDDPDVTANIVELLGDVNDICFYGWKGNGSAGTGACMFLNNIAGVGSPRNCFISGSVSTSSGRGLVLNNTLGGIHIDLRLAGTLDDYAVLIGNAGLNGGENIVNVYKQNSDANTFYVHNNSKGKYKGNFIYSRDYLNDSVANTMQWTTDSQWDAVPGVTQTVHNGLLYTLVDDIARPFRHGTTANATSMAALTGMAYGDYVQLDSDSQYYWYDNSTWQGPSATVPVVPGNGGWEPGAAGSRSWATSHDWPAYLQGGWNSDRTANLKYFGIKYNSSNTEATQGHQLKDLIEAVPTNNLQYVLELDGFINTHMQHTFPVGANNQRLNIIGKDKRNCGFWLRPAQGFDMEGTPTDHPGISIGDYTAAEVVPGQSSGAYRGGLYRDFFVQAMTASNSQYPLWVGPCMGLTIENIWVQGGQQYAIAFSQTQDTLIRGIEGNGLNVGGGMLFDWGCNGMSTIQCFFVNCTNYVKVGALLGGAPTAIQSNAPGKMRFSHCAFDICDDSATSLFYIEGSTALTITDSRFHLNNQAGVSAPVPMFHVVDPPVGSEYAQAAPHAIRLFNNTFRFQDDGVIAAEQGERYLLQNDSSMPVYMTDNLIEGADDMLAKGALTRGTNTESVERNTLFAPVPSTGTTTAEFDPAVEIVKSETYIDANAVSGWQTNIFSRLRRVNKEIIVEAGTVWRFYKGRLQSYTYNQVITPNITPIQINGTTGTPTTSLINTTWESNGTLTAVTNGLGYVTRIYIDALTGNIYALYAQLEYTNLSISNDVYQELSIPHPVNPTGVELVLIGYVAYYGGAAHYDTFSQARHFKI